MRQGKPPSLATLVLLAAGSAVFGCRDPVVEEAIAALGPEDPAVEPGPLHRPNQPCVLCHDEGGESPVMSFAGTLYLDDMERRPAVNAEVLVVDVAGQERRTRTNCAGNFYFELETRWPKYPVWTSALAGEHRIDMESPIYREGSCAACHQDPVSQKSAGHVYLNDDPAVEIALPPLPDGCEDR